MDNKENLKDIAAPISNITADFYNDNSKSDYKDIKKDNLLDNSIEKDKDIEENKMLDKDNKNNEEDELLDEKDELLDEKDELLDEKDKLLDEKDKILDEEDELLDEKDELLEEDNEDNEEDELLDEDNEDNEEDELLDEDNEDNEEDELLDEAEEIFRNETFDNVINFINSNPILRVEICNIAAKSNRIDILKWAKYPLFENTTITAIENGNLEILNWLKENGGIFTDNINSTAIKYNRINILEWILQNFNFKLTEYDCATAVVYDRLSVLKWLRAKDCPWDNDTIKFAIINGSIRCLIYAIENGCEITCDKVNEAEIDINESLEKEEEIDEDTLKCLEYAREKCINNSDLIGGKVYSQKTNLSGIFILIIIILFCTFTKLHY